MEYVRNILNDPEKCLRLGIVSGAIGLAFVGVGLFGPEELAYGRYLFVVFFVASYFLLRNYFKSRVNRRNHPEQPEVQAPQMVQPMAGTEIQQPYTAATATAGTQYGMQHQPSSVTSAPATAPSLPPPYPTFTWPGQQNTSGLPPPPSYDDVAKGQESKWP